MILMDFSQVILATLFVSLGGHTNIELDEDLVRHMVLNSIRANINKFKKDYGELVICCDDRNSWRRSEFPYYKANRKKTRDKSEIDWDQLHRIIETIKEELREHFPYKVLQVEGAEADDIIGVICNEYGTILNNGSEKMLVLSGDKDYIQLQAHANVDQYDPIQKKFIRHDNPSSYLWMHILKGDTGDGIPNVLSADNCLAVGVRQTAMTQKRIAHIQTNINNLDESTKTKLKRNRRLIDLSKTPDHIREEILEQFHTEKTIGRSKLLKFFMDKKLKLLMPEIGNF